MGNLARELTLYDLVTIGVGSIIGSGIFILFRTILILGGKSTSLALTFAAIPNILASLAYAELGALYQRNDVEFTCVADAFGSTNIATITTYILLFFMVFNTVTVLLFIGTLVKEYVPDPFYITLAILFVLSLVNYRGIKTSSTITNTVGIIEITILSLIGLMALPQWTPSLLTHLPKKNAGFMMASFLGLFLFSGYDAIVKLSEETVEPEKNIPRGIMLTIFIVTVLYIAMALSVTSLFDNFRLTHSPIRDMYEKVIHSESGILVTVIGILIVINTAFIGVISMSRFVYGLSKDNRLPSVLQHINDRFHTPHNAILAVFVSMAAALLVYHPERTASIANIFFLVFISILMVCVIILRFKKVERPFTIPGNVYGVPVLMVCGILVCGMYFVYGVMHFWSI